MPTASAPQADCERARGNDARRRPSFARWSLSATRDALPNRSRRACPPHAWLGAAAGAISFHDAIAEQLRRSRRHLGRGTWHSLAERRRACGGFAARVAFRLSLACRVRLVRESLARRRLAACALQARCHRHVCVSPICVRPVIRDVTVANDALRQPIRESRMPESDGEKGARWDRHRPETRQGAWQTRGEAIRKLWLAETPARICGRRLLGSLNVTKHVDIICIRATMTARIALQAHPIRRAG